MTTKTILVAASGGSASDGAIELACRLARRFGARLECFHAKADPTQIMLAATSGGVGMPVDGAWLDQMGEDADALAATIKAGFFKAAEGHGLIESDAPDHPGASAGWRDQVGPASELIAQRARFFDLVVVGRSDRVEDMPATDAIETTVIQSGRPVLLAPAVPPETLGDVIAIGWDGSPRSVRAVAAAMPLLRAAKRSVVLTIGDTEEDVGISDIGAYLGWHGIAAECRTLAPVSGVSAGEQLLATARDAGADMLVMGAYGHAPWRETLFGGATHTIVGTSMLPVLLTH
jgi:nucleotide-binding universal stress UspA family protein